MQKIVIFGGGSGLSQILKGLKLFPVEVTAIVSAADNGGSTGTLRKEFNIPAVGDISKVMVAMADTNRDIIKLLNECRSLKVPLAFKWENKMVVYNLFEEFKRNYLVGENHDDDLIDATDKCDYHIINGLPLSSFMCADERYVSYMQKLFDTMVFVKPKENAIEGYNIKHSKATGIEEVAKKDGYDLNNVMCFGDADNDIAMLIKAKIGVAMGNASEKAKASADFVTNDCDKDGIELALKKYNII